jgi:arylformamidase
MAIYKHYNQEQLNRQYNNRLHVPDFETYFQRWEKLSRETVEKYPVIRDISYGDLSRECLDVFPSATGNSKTFVFIHGGYWQKFDKTNFHFIAKAFHSYGITTVLINYPLAPYATMDEIVASSRKAILWLQQNLAELNGDPHQMYIAGHSAGGHLAAMLMEKEWAQNNTVDFIRGVCTLSGIFNLEPIQLSNLNAVINMTEGTALRNSAVQLIPLDSCPLLLCVGTDETKEFKSQSRELYNKWKNKNSYTRLLQIPGINHYSIAETLLHQGSSVHLAMCKLMGI